MMADNSLTLLPSDSTHVPQADKLVVGNEERGASGAPISVLPLTHQVQIVGWPILTLPRKCWMRRAGKTQRKEEGTQE